MKSSPIRISLVTQTAELLREAIASGEWSHWLPGEVELTRQLHVSRVTLRAALSELEREHLIRAGQGRRREIIGQKPSRRTNPPVRRVVALLSPVPLHQLPASTVFWIDKLRERLEATGHLLEIHESATAYRRQPARKLRELVTRVRAAGWVLFRSTPEMQQWFSENATAAVIVGSRHPGVALSSVDVDYAAGSRHAGGKLSVAGHRRIAIVRPNTALAGDLESVEAFTIGAAPAEVNSALHDGTANGVCESLDRLYASTFQPSALFVFHAAYLLTVLGWVQRRGLRIPIDASVLGRDDDPILEFVLPKPSRYTVNATLFARKISKLASNLVSGSLTSPEQHRLLPNFVRGETIGKRSE